MPLNSEGQDIDYTSDESIQDMLDGENVDYCVEFVGYILRLLGRNFVKKRESELLKCIITNGSKKISLLLWDVDQHEDIASQLVPGAIVHLDNCKGQKKMLNNYSENLDLINYELLIEKKTTVTFLGFHVQRKVVPSIPVVEFEDISRAQGEIIVKAYVKTSLASVSSQSGTMSFGCGSITDGVHKLPLQVASFKTNDSEHLTKGTCIRIRGTISRSGPFLLSCPDISYIEILTEQKMDEKRVINANKPLKRCQVNNDDADNLKKQRIDKGSSVFKQTNFSSCKKCAEIQSIIERIQNNSTGTSDATQRYHSRTDANTWLDNDSDDREVEDDAPGAARGNSNNDNRESPRNWPESLSSHPQHRIDGFSILRRYALMRRRLLYLEPFNASHAARDRNNPSAGATSSNSTPRDRLNFLDTYGPYRSRYEPTNSTQLKMEYSKYCYTICRSIYCIKKLNSLKCYICKWFFFCKAGTIMYEVLITNAMIFSFN